MRSRLVIMMALVVAQFSFSQMKNVTEVRKMGVISPSEMKIIIWCKGRAWESFYFQYNRWRDWPGNLLWRWGQRIVSKTWDDARHSWPGCRVHFNHQRTLQGRVQGINSNRRWSSEKGSKGYSQIETHESIKRTQGLFGIAILFKTYYFELSFKPT